MEDATTAATTTTTMSNHNGFIRKEDLPNTGRDWISLHQTIEFLPAQDVPYNFGRGRSLEQKKKSRRRRATTTSQDDEMVESSSSAGAPSTPATRSLEERYLEDGDVEEAQQQPEDNTQYRVQPFVEGVSDYDTYQQAWRMLGFMIDCDEIDFNNNNDDHHSGSQDENSTGEGCQRYVLWAAYVDLNYEGGGIGEYQFWDADSRKWDTSTCDYRTKANGGSSGRCAKMDCHLEDTHWSLLGFFKHKGYDDWMEQLFKHEGICVWTDDQYSFMKNARKTWPQGCIVSSTVTSSGDTIYYDIKPTRGGGITLGLYTDTRCVKEYKSTGKNDPINVENVIGNLLVNGGSNDHSGDKNKNYNNAASSYSTLSESLSAWDSAFSVWKQCQPCVAYDRHNYGYSVNDASYRGSNYGTYRYGYDDDYSWNNYYSSKYSGADFDCYDDAGYTNVNQCMKFMAKTTMNTATFRDLSLATAQGTLVDSPLAGYRAAKHGKVGAFQTYLFFIVSCMLLVYGAVRYYRARKTKPTHADDKDNNASDDWSPEKPLVIS